MCQNAKCAHVFMNPVFSKVYYVTETWSAFATCERLTFKKWTNVATFGIITLKEQYYTYSNSLGTLREYRRLDVIVI